ncbi:glycosyltransferase family 2 protein [Faecalibacterium sp. An121]|uniref:glycosyltransferase family 2 protein n=1 Tax=Faecalibacterium sp. An121 TaxID=1965550 RepID=UPI000B368E4D|nr:glycosyltransferase family 2 protein [Faecalibacterium sp. An121]OUQ38578.1 glycosyl transferase family 2 [Faecalibacterium sp. An121]
MQSAADLTKQEQQRRQRQLARLIQPEFNPQRVLVLGDQGLAAALQALQVEAWGLAEGKGPALPDSWPQSYDLVVVQGSDVPAPPALPGSRVLFLAAEPEEPSALPAWAPALAQGGLQRDFSWKSWGLLSGAALYRPGSEDAAGLAQGYEEAMEALRLRLDRAEQSCRDYQKLTEHQRSELSAAHQHEQQLEGALSSVTGSHCWKLTWPVRYLLSKGRALWHSFPLFVLLAQLRQEGLAGLRQRRQDRRYYEENFPGQTFRAARLAPVELLVRQSKTQPQGPLISIVVPLYNTPLPFLTELLDSVVNQTYRNWELCLVDAGQDEKVGQAVAARMAQDSRIRYQKLAKNDGIAGNTNAGFALARGEYIALLDHDDILHPCALWYAAQAIVQEGADFVYTDEVTFEGKVENTTLYHLKPDFMLDNLRANNYICHLSVFQAALLQAAGGGERGEYNGSQDYDLYLRLTEQAQKIVHIPHVLYYWRSSPTSVASGIEAKTYCIEAAIKALYAHYARLGVAVDEVSMIPDTPGFYKTDYTIQRPGLVSILIPSCDHAKDLRTCVDSIYAKTTYPHFEIIVIENNSKEEETFRTYERLERQHPDSFRVVRWEGTGFNYSALNNFGARFAQGEYLLLLNNDTEVITPRWLEEMVMFAQQERIGCVGAKLLYPDDTIQHAGLGFGYLTLAAHMHKNFPVANPGYMGRLIYAHDVYGVTGACLMIRRTLYEEVGGLDESFAVAFNDVDFCVRVHKAGYQNLFTPFAMLYHYESKSRGLDESPEKRARFVSEVTRFQTRWKAELAAGDPCLNPNFDIDRDDFRIKLQPLE